MVSENNLRNEITTATPPEKNGSAEQNTERYIAIFLALEIDK